MQAACHACLGCDQHAHQRDQMRGAARRGRGGRGQRFGQTGAGTEPEPWREEQRSLVYTLSSYLQPTPCLGPGQGPRAARLVPPLARTGVEKWSAQPRQPLQQVCFGALPACLPGAILVVDDLPHCALRGGGRQKSTSWNRPVGEFHAGSWAHRGVHTLRSSPVPRPRPPHLVPRLRAPCVCNHLPRPTRRG